MKKIQTFILREIAGEFILVPTGKTTLQFNGMITLSDTAAYIWKNLEEVADVDEMVQKMCSEYDIDEETAAADTKEFIDQLVAKGMIEL